MSLTGIIVMKVQAGIRSDLGLFRTQNTNRLFGLSLGVSLTEILIGCVCFGETKVSSRVRVHDHW